VAGALVAGALVAGALVAGALAAGAVVAGGWLRSAATWRIGGADGVAGSSDQTSSAAPLMTTTPTMSGAGRTRGRAER
jgi:hypothetical protein